jgi:hypothetical protein
MIPVYQNGKGLDSFDFFYRNFLKICTSHRKERKAMAFAFILYDFNNPAIHNILNSESYWLSLNSISGEYLSIFSINYLKAETQGKDFRSLVRNWINPSISTSQLIEKYFDKEIVINYPAVMFFQVHDKKVFDYVLVQLDEQNLQDAFEELKSYISSAVSQLAGVSNENKGNVKEVFNLVKTEVSGRRSIKVTKRGFKKATSFAGFISTILGLKG